VTRHDASWYIVLAAFGLLVAMIAVLLFVDPARAGTPSGRELSPLAAPAPSPSPHHFGPWRRVWAPWYGPGYYGHRTACGQILTKTLIGYASRTGKCGDLREFRWKGKTIIAPRVDWGPTTPSLEVDLTAGLVLALGRVTAAGKPYTDYIWMRSVR
jgi:hypothetical protein